MISSSASWYDGKISTRREVTLTCSGSGELCVCGDGIYVSAPLKAVRIDPSLGGARRLIHFPDGAVAEGADHPFLDALQLRQGKGIFFRTVSRWESSMKRVLVALAAMLLIGFLFVRYAVPLLAEKAAFALPAASGEMIGQQTLQLLDRVLLKPSALPKERRQELTALFARMKSRHREGRGWRLEFRSGEAVGANAFALPDGTVIVTDRLVALATSDDQIAGVLAHEIGHLTHRHALRHLLQNSATALIVATATGDIASITSLSATLPTALIDAKYSRDFEVEADDAAVAYLKGAGASPTVYAEMLTRLGKDHKEQMTEKGARFGELFSDHPLVRERVQRVQAAK